MHIDFVKVFFSMMFPVSVLFFVIIFFALLRKSLQPRKSSFMEMIKEGKPFQENRFVDDLSYAFAGPLLTPAERSFFGVLAQAVDPSYVIAPKVRVADVIKVLPCKDRQAQFNKIAMKHFDFVVCDAETFTPQYVVELNDSSHLNQNRKIRDEFLHSTCKAVGLPFIQFKVQSGYSVAAVSGIIRTELNESLT